jgi:HK97 family phage prohead protease
MEKRFRTIEIDHKRADAKSRTYPASLSSEMPVERSWGWEVLDHTEAAIDMSRCEDGLPLLFAHDQAKPIGMVENVRLVDKKLRASVRFFSTPEGDSAMQMCAEGLRTLSIGYAIDEAKEDGEQDGMTVYRVTKWMPFEASLVTIPADRTVGIGRSQTNSRKGIKIMETNNDNQLSPAETVRSIVAMGQQYEKFLRPGDVANAVRSQHSVDQFKELIMQRMESGSTLTSSGLAIGMNPQEIQRFSIARALVASITGDWRDAGLEREASRALGKQFGMSAEGFFVPAEVWGGRRDFNIGTGSEAGNLVNTDLRADMYVDALRNAFVLPRLGCRILPNLTGNVDLPRKVTRTTLGMLSEIGSASEVQPTTAKVTLTPKRVSAYIEVSKQALIQSALALENMLRDDLLQGAAELIEDQAFNGVGTGVFMRGVRNTVGIGTATAGANGALLAWSHLVDLETACANANAANTDLAGYVINSRTRARAKIVPRGTNLDYIVGNDTVVGPDGLIRVNQARTAITNTLPSNLTKGTSTTICSAALFASDWSMGVLGLFGAPDITVDPYTKADTGQVKITINQFADFGVRQPGAFAKIEDLLT